MAPSMFPQAKFDPIPPDLDLDDLVDRASNFEWVLRISAAQIRNIGQQEFEKLVLYHVIQGGKPLVIEKWNDRLPKSLFSAEWLEATYDKKRRRCLPSPPPPPPRRMLTQRPQGRMFAISSARRTYQ
jgi:hypothetical protein